MAASNQIHMQRVLVQPQMSNYEVLTENIATQTSLLHWVLRSELDRACVTEAILPCGPTAVGTITLDQRDFQAKRMDVRCATSRNKHPQRRMFVAG